MSRSPAVVNIECDECDVSIELDLPDIEGGLKHYGWVVIDGLDLCDECRPPSAEELARATVDGGDES